MKPSLVTWHDAHADRSGTWVAKSEIDSDPYVVKSIGWLFDPPPKPGHVTLCQSIGDDDAFDSLLHIPTGWIVSVVSLGE